MPRLALCLEYDGSAFCGWQRQGHARSVQGEVERAVAGVADEPVQVVVAGRTDAGVHASGQVAHFDTTARRSLRAWLLGINSNLPADISIGRVEEVPDDFHARYSAVARTYRYMIFNSPVRSALHHRRAWWLHGALDLPAMQQAAYCLLGEHDFSAFRAAQCQSRTATRHMQHIEIRRQGAFIVIECCANAFLHHMVRNIVGSLVEVGRGRRPSAWLATVLAGRERREAGMTAPAGGLYLCQVHYPDRFARMAPRLRPTTDLRAPD